MSGCLHVHSRELHWCARPAFCFSRSGENCDGVAEELRLGAVLARETKDHGSGGARNGGKDVGLYFELLEHDIAHGAA